MVNSTMFLLESLHGVIICLLRQAEGIRVVFSVFYILTVVLRIKYSKECMVN